MASLFTLEDRDRIQLSLQSNFPVDMAISAYQEKPIVIAIEQINDSGMTVEVSSEDFIVKNKLSEASHSNARFYADIESQHYSRLVLDVEPGAAWKVVLDSSITESELSRLTTQPIVAMLIERSGGWSLLLCGDRKFKFIRCSARDSFTANESEVPSHLMRMMHLVDEPVSKSIDGIDMQTKRAHGLLKLLKSYGRNKLTLRAREELQLNIEEVKDFLSKCAQSRLDVPEYREYEHAFRLELLGSLSQQMGSKNLETMLKRLEKQALLSLQRGRIKSSSSISEDVVETTFAAFDDEDPIQLIRSLFKRELHKDFPLHPCSNCGSESILEKTLKAGKNKHRFSYRCESCDHCLPRDRASERRMSSVASWNRLNPSPGVIHQVAAILGLSLANLKDEITRIIECEKLIDILIGELKKHIATDFESQVIHAIEQLKNVKDAVMYGRLVLMAAKKAAQ